MEARGKQGGANMNNPNRKSISKKKTPSVMLGVSKPFGTHVGTFLCLPTNRCLFGLVKVTVS
ncbi:hypothetical protein BCT49_17215 [Vibrio lentus]|uniref:Uncharacterized protein n=2 Tax=Vibrio lentus TaxID=136468 RepID=A0A2N7JVT8_9VIBR|nr:hypothetical protein BCT49_17215 [Vibrio lentus]